MQADRTPHANASSPLSKGDDPPAVNDGASTAGVGGGGGAGAATGAGEEADGRLRYERSSSSAPAAAKTKPSGSPKTYQRVIWPAKPPAIAPTTQSCVSKAES